MELQLAVVAVVILAAVCYLGRRAWRSWSGGCSGCAGGRGKEDTARGVTLIPADQLTQRLRDSARPGPISPPRDNPET